MTKKPMSSSTEVSPDGVLDMLTKQIAKYDNTKKADVIRKLTELINPGSTFIAEPHIKPAKAKGHKKIDTSTRRDACAFELLESQHDSHSPSPTAKKAKVMKVRLKDLPIICLS
jgi:hypothetical protein